MNYLMIVINIKNKDMKKINLLIIIVFAFCSVSMNAQTPQKLPLLPPIIIDDLPPEQPDYYTGKNIISGNGFSFKNLDEDEDFLRIGNVNNMKFGTSPYISLPPPIDGEEQIIRHLRAFARFNDINQVFSSARDALGTAIINQFKAANNASAFNIIFIVNMNGTVAEVEFLLNKDPLLFSIPPEKFYQMELLLKQRVTFTVRQSEYLKHIPGVIANIKVKDL